LEFKEYAAGDIDGVPYSVLIESDWNLKDNPKPADIHSGAGINRIRLEFKGTCH